MNRPSNGDFDAGNWFIGAVKNNPEGLLLLAAGCALLMRSKGLSVGRGSDVAPSYSRNDRPQNYPTRSDRSVGDRLFEGAQQAGDYVSAVGDSVVDTAASYASSASSYAEDVVRSGAERSGRMVQQAQSSIADAVSHVVQRQPFAVALAGIAAGAAVAAAFPATDLENRALGATGERLRDAAGRAGEQLKDAAAKAGESLAGAADQRGLNAEGLKDMAREAGDAFSKALDPDRNDTRTPPKSTFNQTTNNQRSTGEKRGPN
jgi:gas vesicle protein